MISFYGGEFKSKLLAVLDGYLLAKIGKTQSSSHSKHSTVVSDKILRLTLKAIFTIIRDNIDEIQKIYGECNNTPSSPTSADKGKNAVEKIKVLFPTRLSREV
ncbi:unnamed protein product [Mucor hiemalis]